MKGLCFGTLIWDDDRCDAKATIKQQLILIKHAFPIVRECQQTLSRTPFYSKHLHRYRHSFVTVRSKTRYHRLLPNRKQNTLDYLMLVQRQVDASVWRRLFGCCGLCGQRRDDVCTPAMAPGLQSHKWNSGWTGGGGQSGSSSEEGETERG